MKDKWKSPLALADSFELVPQNGTKQREVPSEFVVLKFGKNKYTLDGNEDEFDFDEKDADRILEEFNRRGRDLVIDLEHATLIPGHPAPAYGWVREFGKNKDGLVARPANWSDKARDYLSKGEYRYHSPVIYVDPKTRRPKALHSIGLTNHPSIHNIKDLVAASDLDGTEDSGQIVKGFKNAIKGVKAMIDKEYERAKDPSKDDTRHVLMLQDILYDNLQKFSEYVESRDSLDQGMVQAFSDGLFLSLSDVSDNARRIVDDYRGEDALRRLRSLRESDGVTSAESQFIDALIKETMEDMSETAFSDSTINKTKTKTKTGDAIMLTKKMKVLKAFADNKMDDAAAIERELMAEELPAGEENELDITVLDEVKEKFKAVLASINEIAAVLDVTPELQGEGADVAMEEIDSVALSDLCSKKAKEVVGVLKAISDVHEANLDLRNPKAFSDAVIVERLATPDNEDVKKLASKIALTDIEVTEQKAKDAVKSALDAGTIPKCREQNALEFAKRDLKAFNDNFSPETGIVIVPTSENSSAAVSNSNKKGKDNPVLALSDSQRKIYDNFGLTEDEINAIINPNQDKEGDKK